MAIFTIIIKGISMSYIKNVEGKDVWRVLFPFDKKSTGDEHECHNVRLKLHECDDGIVLGREGLRGLKIDIIPKDVAPSSQTEMGRNYCDFIDLTGEYSHDQIRAANNDLTLSNLDGVILTIPNAKLQASESSPQPYKVIRKQGSVTAVLPTIGLTGKAEIDCGDVDIVVSGPRQFTISVKAGSTVYFDNDCDNDSKKANPPADFPMVYRVIEHHDGTDEQYVVEGDETVPCNMVRISKPPDFLP